MPETTQKSSRIPLGIGSLVLCILFCIMVCAIITQDIDEKSNDSKYVNERRARTGLLWMTVPLLIAAFIANVVVIVTA